MSGGEETVGQFIEESITDLERAGEVQAFDERMLHVPVSRLEPATPVTVEPQTPVLEAIAIMREQGLGCVLVVRGSKLKGIFTERDVLTGVAGGAPEAGKGPVRKLMTANPETLRPTDSIAYALNLMSLGGYRHVPIVDAGGLPVGVISVKDIIRYLVSFFPKSVLNLPTLPRGNYAQEREGA